MVMIKLWPQSLSENNICLPAARQILQLEIDRLRCGFPLPRDCTWARADKLAAPHQRSIGERAPREKGYAG